ncbi:low molecular weight protein-tyrosine-phosphatase [Luteimonas aquatica]|uniref:low molecular weight protein-tyrosine-phosphatase n=1 Tax=Luteimonas aquatica TaxID=450364 RepID=UPI001F56D473|nr:low molecular weight protein-tyrosine-phosphatase [Luteimonas aquatica]
MRLLVVCLGNICRSPMAEGALRARIEEAGLSASVRIDSAGTGGWHAGEPPDPRAIAAARRHGVDLSGLRARKLQARDFERFDALLCADHANLRDVRAMGPAGGRAEVALLMEWAGQAGVVPDPYGGGEADFERVWRQVDGAAQAIAARLRAGTASVRARTG